MTPKPFLEAGPQFWVGVEATVCGNPSPVPASSPTTSETNSGDVVDAAGLGLGWLSPPSLSSEMLRTCHFVINRN